MRAGIALVCFVGADRLPFHSWEPPFTEFGDNGDRIISQVWKASGTAVVNNNFVRLTPDRQSKRGALWSRKALGVSTVSCVLKLRISGQGAKFYGDGLALWFVHQGYYVEGDMHGSVEGFTGFGIIFDTFNNAESGARHRDVTARHERRQRARRKRCSKLPSAVTRRCATTRRARTSQSKARAARASSSRARSSRCKSMRRARARGPTAPRQRCRSRPIGSRRHTSVSARLPATSLTTTT